MKTKLGKAIRAASMDPGMAQVLVSISTRSILWCSVLAVRYQVLQLLWYPAVFGFPFYG